MPHVCGQDCERVRLISLGMVCACSERSTDEIKAIDISTTAPQYMLLACVTNVCSLCPLLILAAAAVVWCGCSTVA